MTTTVRFLFYSPLGALRKRVTIHDLYLAHKTHALGKQGLLERAGLCYPVAHAGRRCIPKKGPHDERYDTFDDFFHVRAQHDFDNTYYKDQFLVVFRCGRALLKYCRTLPSRRHNQKKDP
jgi:hypothetical protein